MISEMTESRYVRVKDDAGNVLVCPLNDNEEIGPAIADSEDCIESEVVGRYAGRLKIVDAEA